ncbi:hypothetical protein B9Z19DRAFT_477237 [Tuber borchii]|uniref:Uncharacterized protein n=1 Tax=Tuber borchii TaxID=42251 RepID=A0A2T7A3A4_TUBBO|nr:hypothetical protein B9Z19DRAFT_477237 [Tuber borchii]
MIENAQLARDTIKFLFFSSFIAHHFFHVFLGERLILCPNKGRNKGREKGRRDWENGQSVSLNATWVFSHLPTRDEWVPLLCFRQTQSVGGAKEEKEKKAFPRKNGEGKTWRKRSSVGRINARETALFTWFPPAEIDLEYDISNTRTSWLTFPRGVSLFHGFCQQCLRIKYHILADFLPLAPYG